MSGPPPSAPLEFWGGVECTVNRVGDHHGDQLVLTGHDRRADDLDRFAALGLSAIRYPLLWERIAPDRPDECDWAWTDARLERLRMLKLRPIAGLVHHGSGPRYTDLLDPRFAEKLGCHAARVAERYDWIGDWTPVNEPLTTARFSALYGHWHPHAKNERLFWSALLNQTDGVRAAMRAIRRIRPDARLIQTDDLGFTYATPAMREQAGFDNERRWAGWDLLFGRLTPEHPLWDRLASFGLADRLRSAADAPCPPDIIGLNHYVTSDRFLDRRIDRYALEDHGGNGRDKYADVAAVRVVEPPPSGWALALRQAWERYRTPLALTEVHLGCTREEQMRFAVEAWSAALAARAEGADVRAVTAWSLLGSHGWNTLLTGAGVYEPGVFDTRGGAPRATGLASAWQALSGGVPLHPAADGPGWWRRPVRLLHEAVHVAEAPYKPPPAPSAATRPLLILGATGTLGQALAGACRRRGLAFVLTDRATLDLCSAVGIATALDRHRPWAAINAAGWVRVDDAEEDIAGCHAANAIGAAALARACSVRGIACVSFSSDLVFDGLAQAPYTESDEPRPLSAYGRSKHALEEACANLPHSLVVRTAAFFSPLDGFNFAAGVVRALAAGRAFDAAGDHIVSPTFVPHLIDALLDLVIDGTSGLRHLTNCEALTWADFARRIAGACDLDPAHVHDVPGRLLGWRARRPPQAALASRYGKLLPSLQTGIDSFATAFMAT